MIDVGKGATRWRRARSRSRSGRRHGPALHGPPLKEGPAAGMHPIPVSDHDWSRARLCVDKDMTKLRELETIGGMPIHRDN